MQPLFFLTHVRLLDIRADPQTLNGFIHAEIAVWV